MTGTLSWEVDLLTLRPSQTHQLKIEIDKNKTMWNTFCCGVWECCLLRFLLFVVGCGIMCILYCTFCVFVLNNGHINYYFRYFGTMSLILNNSHLWIYWYLFCYTYIATLTPWMKSSCYCKLTNIHFTTPNLFFLIL